MVKEELPTFEGKPLFPERRAYTVPYPLSEPEQDLYEAVTQYVREEMNRADRLKQEGDRRGQTLGFALTVLQRRLASSPEAILRSLERRRRRLERRRQQMLSGGGESLSEGPFWDKVRVRGGSAPISQCVLTGEFALQGAL
jgi:hypothetical protein